MVVRAPCSIRAGCRRASGEPRRCLGLACTGLGNRHARAYILRAKNLGGRHAEAHQTIGRAAQVLATVCRARATLAVGADPDSCRTLRADRSTRLPVWRRRAVAAPGTNILATTDRGHQGRPAARSWPRRRPTATTGCWCSTITGSNPALCQLSVRQPEGSRAGDAGRDRAISRRHLRQAVQDAGGRHRRGKEIAGKISYGSVGSGSVGHLAMVLLGKQAASIYPCPYRGGAPAVTMRSRTHDLVNGSAALLTPQVSCRPAASVCSRPERRASGHPKVPTIGESGFQAPGE